MPGLVSAEPVVEDDWIHTPVELRTSFETVKLPGSHKLGLVGTGILIGLRPGLRVGPAVYGSISGPYGGLFTVGAEAAAFAVLAGPLNLEAGVYVGGGGGGGAPVGGGLMVRSHADLMWDFGGYRAGASLSNVRFPSGRINGTQFGLVLGMTTDFIYAPAGRSVAPFEGVGRTGLGFDRLVAVVGAYRPASRAQGASGSPLHSRVGTVGVRADHFHGPLFFGGLESSAAASGGAAGYAEVLGTLGVEVPLAADNVTLGTRMALGMGGGGDIPVGGGLLGKVAIDAALRLSRDLSLNLEVGRVRAPQGGFGARFGSLGLRWDLDHPQGSPTALTRQEWTAGVETYRLAARKLGPPASLQNVSFKLNRFVGETLYLSGQVHSAYAGGAGAFSVGLVGLGARGRLGDRFLVGAELLAGAAGGGGVATGGGAVWQPMAYVGVDLTPALSLRLSAGQVKATNGPLNTMAMDLALAFSFGVASRP